MAYVRGNEAEVDAWEKLGNEGWNWDSLYPYYLRSENFSMPSTGLQAEGVTFNASAHGESGAVRTGYPLAFGNMTLTRTVGEAWEEVGLPHNVDMAGGNVRGVSTNPLTLAPGQPDLRWDAARAYWYPVEGRPNLQIIKGTARRLVWTGTDGESGGIRASGVEYLTEHGQTAVLSATREVVLSAGSLRSPLILEASGVGNPRWVELAGLHAGNATGKELD